MEHLKALTAVKGMKQEDMTLTLHSQNLEFKLDEYTKLGTTTKPGSLFRMFESTRKHPKNLTRAQAYSSFDNSLILNIFSYDIGEQLVADAEGRQFDDLDSLVAELGLDPALFTKESLRDFIGLCHPAFVQSTSKPRFAMLRHLYDQVKGTEGAAVRVDADTEAHPGTWVSIAVSNVMPAQYMAKVTGLLSSRGLDIMRLHLDLIRDPATSTGTMPGHVAVIRVQVLPGLPDELPTGVKPFPGTTSELESEPWRELLADLRRVRWLDEQVLELARSSPSLNVQQAEILSAFCAMLHGPLSKISSGFSRASLLACVGNPYYADFAADIANLFIARFDPKNPLTNEQLTQRANDLRTRIGVLADQTARALLPKMVEVVECTLRTNLFFPDRYALALRVDPALLVGEDQLQPFGVFFVHGDCFDGFHNRFQNIARGGLRIVTPASQEQFGIESSRVYDEVYRLSNAQELKNKDIPEGGAKAVVLVDTSRATGLERLPAMRTAVKGFTNSLLDLIVSDENTPKIMVDHLGFDEIVYLGPDEQVIPEDIDWIIEQAGKRGYPCPAAFMSSKPRAGFNHKQYGVTSEGVAVFLDVALRHNGIQPDKQPFTVKITGGPDGDVAGNLMRILFRDYGDNVRVVGVSDGSGCAEDAEGLAHSELLRLFEAALPIAEIDPTTLSPDGKLYLVGNEEGVKMRNTMHNRLKADVFVPGGGRPSTMHADNWDAFLDPETGKPSSPLIVEGANIFLTTEAREQLFETAGVLIVKDSSANKCGVITSSYEICASMLLSEEEFLAIKEELVEDVLKKLRDLARREAELMFREYSHYPGALPLFSQRISNSINRAYAAIRRDITDIKPGDETFDKLLPLFLDEHLPRKLAEVAGDRVLERIPIDYLRNAFAKSLASKLLYKEGVHFLESQPEDRLADLALQYVEEEKHVRLLAEMVAQAQNMNDDARTEVVRLLNKGGPRTRLGVF
jgi:glutamate dehydrogenase